MVPKLSASAMPRARPSGGGVPQPAFSAASRSTPACRGASASSARRKSSGSAPAASASSSRNVSTAKAVWVEPTERHQSTGTPTSVVVRPTLRLGMA